MKLFFSLVFAFFCFSANAQTKPAPAPASFDFLGVGISQVVQLIYSEAMPGAYVIEPDVLTDTRTVSFRYDGSKGDVRSFIVAFFDSLGLQVVKRAGVDFIGKKKVPEVAPIEQDVLIYRPRFRDGSYLVDLLGPLFKGSFTTRKAVHAAAGSKAPQGAVPPGSAAAQIDRITDTLVFTGTPEEVAMLKKMLPQVDFSAGDVMVRALLYEVQTSQNEGSAFSLALNLLGGKLSLGLGSINPLENLARFKNQTIDAVFSSLSNDSRFKVLSTPSLRVHSGGTGRFIVGQDVPVLGSITYPGNGQAPVQSVNYLSSGVIFELSPQLRDENVRLDVRQQISDFVVTSTGVNNSPTLNKREVQTALTMADGEVVVLGGLAQNRQAQGESGMAFLPSWMRDKTANSTSSEIILILQLTKL